MKKGTKGVRKNPEPKSLPLGRATPLPITENDAAWLVGGIVEKGFSGTRPSVPSSSPRPSVLPFPVARHRSHGPHWAPTIEKSNVKDRDDEDVNDEEEENNGMYMAADVANPVPRKEKKGMDFTMWQEILKNSGLPETKKEIHLTGAESGTRTDWKTSANLSKKKCDGDNAKEQSMTVDGSDSKIFKAVKEESNLSCYGNDKSKGSITPEITPALQNGSSRENQMTSEMQHLPITNMASSFTADSGGDVESQIDAENRARLSKMSPDEIAEAQAELTAKLNPKLIDALKRRGQAKVTRHKFSLSDDTEADGLQREKNLSKLVEISDSSRPHKPVKVADRDTHTVEGNKVFPRTTERSPKTWDAWRNRVERARDIRFSLEGSVIKSDSARVSDCDNTSSQSGYSADNVSERDFLRTEGDPGGAGYTIKEAVALTRSVVPGQRALALHLIASLLDKAIKNISQNQVDSASGFAEAQEYVDWEAIWAFALGPEPELVLSLRMSLDDNHNSVVLACAKAIQHALSCEMNEIIFDISEKTPSYLRDICTAPVFRSKPDITTGFLCGGYWKYNTKPSNIFPQFGEESMRDKPEDEPTIRDDIVIAGQDIAAGLVRMGILPRICYLLETDPAASLEECLISVLIATARHSPTCAAEILKCERLLQTIADRFALKEHMDITPCKIKSVTLFKVLARIDKQSCSTFIQNGLLHKMTWHLYRHPISLDRWLKSGKNACKLSSSLLVEQLRLWKVSIQYGYHLSDFSDLFTSVCVWLSLPTFDKLIDSDVVNEYCAIVKESYLLLDVLACKLPNFYSYMREKNGDNKEAWSWDTFARIIELALEWMDVKSISYFSRFFYHSEDGGKGSLLNSEISSLLWVISSVLSMLSSLLKAVISEDMTSLHNQPLEWLPDFVTKIGIKIIKNGYLRFSGLGGDTDGSFVQYLHCLRLRNSQELAIASTCCLQGLVQVVTSVDKLIQHANLDIHKDLSKFIGLSTEDRILANGILKSSVFEVQDLLTTLMKLITNEWQLLLPVETFGRGGPAPGVGAGWGAKGGGYWSLKTMLAQQDARLLIHLFEVSEIPSAENSLQNGEMSPMPEKLNCALAACLIVGPTANSVVEQLLNFIFQASVLEYLDTGICKFRQLRKGFKPFEWNYEKEEYLSFANALATHFRNRWLIAKKKKKETSDKNYISSQTSKKGNRLLETIHEEPKTVEEPTSLTQEWAHQRLHLPTHWFLSAISAVHSEKSTDLPSDYLQVAKGGLFFLLGLEAIPTCSVIQCVPVVWKLHALSVILLSGMGVLEDEKSRDVYETLQNLYGETLDEKKVDNLMRFEADIHENYSTFIENLVDQFAAESYGDLVFGRQVAIYLHRSAEASVRLATWNALSNARVLELLPPLDKCLTKTEGYLEHVEDDERILEAYVKSWVSGALDKAVARGSASSSVALHHLSYFIFGSVKSNMLSLRNKLAKSLLRDYSRKGQHEGMMVKLICYKKSNPALLPVSEVASTLPMLEMDQRLQVLKEISAGDAVLMATLEKLEFCIKGEIP